MNQDEPQEQTPILSEELLKRQPPEAETLVTPEPQEPDTTRGNVTLQNDFRPEPYLP